MAQGLARDTRVRWALEEVGQPYKVRLVSFRAMKEPALGASSFGQIPTYEEGDLALFETGSIVFHIAERPGATLRPGRIGQFMVTVRLTRWELVRPSEKRGLSAAPRFSPGSGSSLAQYARSSGTRD